MTNTEVFIYMKSDYYVGLDLGSGSVGWAVTDSDYHLLRSHGKALWGVRLFDTAKTAEERRVFRTSRRRLQRRNWRLNLLQQIFVDEINKIDDVFFRRLKESRYLPEDKHNTDGSIPDLPYSLFIDKSYTDKDYHRQFPTIYHLRKWLMETDTTPDIRLVYLAFHHMLKHRGHFLFSGSIDEIRNFNNVFKQLSDALRSEDLPFNYNFTEDQVEKAELLLKNSQLTKSQKKTLLIQLFNGKTPCEKAAYTLLAGGTAKLSDLLGDELLNDSEKPKISFTDASYDDYVDSLQSTLGERYHIIEALKAVYDWAVLADILKGFSSISEAKVATYEKHHNDLVYLKKLVKENLSVTDYKELFVKTNEKLTNYSAYIGMTKKNGKKQSLENKLCSKEDFYSYLKKNVLNRIADETKTEFLKAEIEYGTFLPKQTTKDNSVIPNQLHLYEFDRIIANLAERIPMLKEQKDKLRSLLTFRIPYYIGPLNGIVKNGERTNWMQRKSEGTIYPWNFSEIVDEEESARHFIQRMTNHCTYLPAEDVLPKYSPMYSRFMVLNELNNLRLDGQAISVPLKQQIFTELFMKKRKVTQKSLKQYLVREGIAKKEVEITGIDGDFKGSLTAYLDFKEKLTGMPLNTSDMEILVLNITLFGDDKRLLSKRLSRLFPKLTDKQRNSICNLPYRDWGRLSSAFLNELTAISPETGENWTILRTLWETNDNLMQILSDKYDFADAIEKQNQENGDFPQTLSYELIDRQPLSPAVKRQIWQTILIIRELCQAKKQPPKRIFIEMAREKQNTDRTVSRRKQLIDLYQSCKKEERDWINELNEKNDSDLRRDKLYLYYVQMGRCMYSGEPIELSDLWNDQKYDIDHIYPQSKVMDDSLDNRVLVKRTYNADKTDIYPIAEDIRKKQTSFWKMLLEKKFISEEKYHRLTRNTGFEPSELAGFIARQLVETRQSTKAVASILKQFLPDTEIVYVKAKTVSQFRQDFHFIKVRDMNDFHHAKDAYLNIVVGNVYFTKFTKNAMWYVKEHPGRSYNLQKMFTAGVVERNGQTAWTPGENGSINIVRQVMGKNNVIITRRSYEVSGGLFDQQLLKKGKGQVPVKSSDPRLRDIEKYGGYNKETGTYFTLVQSKDKKGNLIRTIEFVPLRLKDSLEKNEMAMKTYMAEEHGLNEPEILLSKIQIDTLFCIDGFYMWLSGRTGKQLVFKNANQLILSEKNTAALKKVLKFISRRKENKELQIYPSDELTNESLTQLYDQFLDKLKNTIYSSRLSAQIKTLEDKKEVFEQLSPEDKCTVLSEILHMFQCQSASANLKLIDGPGSAGILHLNSDITKCKHIQIIHQSPAGLYEQVLNLNQL